MKLSQYDSFILYPAMQKCKKRIFINVYQYFSLVIVIPRSGSMHQGRSPGAALLLANEVCHYGCLTLRKTNTICLSGLDALQQPS